VYSSRYHRSINTHFIFSFSAIDRYNPNRSVFTRLQYYETGTEETTGSQLGTGWKRQKDQKRNLLTTWLGKFIVSLGNRDNGLDAQFLEKQH